MSTYLKYHKLTIGTFRATGDAKLQAQFLDDRGNSYHWVPRWSDLIDLLEKASNVEDFNKPRSTWLADFAGAVRSVLSNAQELLLDAQTIHGRIVSIKNGNLVVLPIHFDDAAWCHYTRTDQRDAVSLPVAFPIDVDWCLDHLERAADVLVVNGYAARVRLRPLVPPDS